MFFPMRIQEEKELSPAQKELLSFASHLEANDLYKHLSTTLSISIVNYLNKNDRDDPTAIPTYKALEAWYFTLELMDHLHDISVEREK